MAHSLRAKPTLDRRVQAGAGEGGADVAEGGGVVRMSKWRH